MIKSWAINVNSNKLKRVFFSSQAKKIGLKFNYYNAVTPDKLSEYNYIYNVYKQRILFARPLMKTEICCAISHINLWKQLINDLQADYYCIFEDDVNLNNDIISFLDNPFLNNIDLIKYSGRKKVPFKRKKALNQKYDLVQLAFGPLDAAAYRISKKAAQILIPYAQNFTHPIDVMMDRSYDHGININAILPYPADTDWHFDLSDPLYTDIGPRTFKYEANRSFFSKTLTRIERLKTSIKKRIAHLKLLFKS